MAALKYRDPVTGTMVPLIGYTTAESDAVYARSSGEAMSGAISVPAPAAAGDAATKSYADATAGLPAGAIMPFGGDAVPATWPFLLCQGQAVSRTTYAALFAAIGGNYGVGDGSTTFNVPSLKGDIAVMLDAGDGNFNVLNNRPGEYQTTLTKATMPANHSGSLDLHGSAGPNLLQVLGGDMWGAGGSGSQYASCGTPVGGANSTGTTNFSLGFGNQPHNNIQPFLTLHYIIKY